MRAIFLLEIWFVQHGETEWNSSQRWQGQTDVPLSEMGRRQARRLGPRLGDERFDGAWASDLSRCRETARLALPHAAVHADLRLREMCFGILEGKRHEELSAAERAAVDEWWTDPYGLRIPGGESLLDLETRVLAWRAELPTAGRFAVFTHGGTIRAVLYAVTGRPRGRAWKVQLDNCGITRLQYGDRTTILCVNECGHLQASVKEAEGVEVA